MAELGFLPRVLLARTDYGTAFYFDRRLGLLATAGPAGALRSIEPDELRRGYPVVWAVWVRFAALLPEGVPTPRPGGPLGSGVASAVSSASPLV